MGDTKVRSESHRYINQAISQSERGKASAHVALVTVLGHFTTVAAKCPPKPIDGTINDNFPFLQVLSSTSSIAARNSIGECEIP